ncbi:MAG: T9SS type A sorting domain-containing protein, partial [Flavobacteriales bacterium]|nr:T9SS type A sorting domain-containing protein [Flavobacteriales bacterium]
TNTTVNTIYVAPNEPDPLVLQLTALDVTCLNSDNGALDLSVVSGNAPYTYAWSNSASTEDQSDLPAGSYTVTVTDDSLLTATATAEIIEDRQFQDPVVGAITGPLSVQSWKPYTYVVTTPGQSEFEWTVSGGELLSTTSNTAEILWHAGPDGTLYIQEKDQHGCYGNDSTQVPILFVGIDEAVESGFRIFPNPSDGLITIEVLEITGNEKVEVRDLHGRLIQSRAITSNSTQLNLGNMASGVYNAILTNENGTTNRKLIFN